MFHSTITTKGQTTIPSEVREALQLKPGDKLAYIIDGGRVTLRPQVSLASLAGALASDKGKGMTFTQIRAEAARRDRRKRGSR